MVVNRSELAALLGVSLPTINSKVKKGMPFLTKGGRGQEWSFETADVIAWEKEQVAQSSEENESPLMWERRKAKADAELAEVKAAKAKGEVATLDEIERQYSEAAHEIKARLRQIPSRAAPQLLGVQTEREIKEILLDEIDEVLLSIANDE